MEEKNVEFASMEGALEQEGLDGDRIRSLVLCGVARMAAGNQIPESIVAAVDDGRNVIHGQSVRRLSGTRGSMA